MLALISTHALRKKRVPQVSLNRLIKGNLS